MLTPASSIMAGLLLAALYTVSPLFTLSLAAAALVLPAAGRGLAPRERRVLWMLLGAALALRFAFIGGALVGGIPWLNDLSVGALQGDDAYYLGRAIRARDILLGLTDGRYDYFVVTDEYGRTSYLQLLTVLQVLFGPTPYGMRAVNAVVFVAAAVILFRVVRPVFGAATALCGLAVLLFLPSLFVSSTSLLKESVYFLATAVLLAAVVAVQRRPRAWPAAIAVAMAGLYVLDDLRRGALVLSLAGIGIGLMLPLVFKTPRRAVAAVVLAGVVAAGALAQPALKARGVDAVTGAAKTHAGHVFTVGHAYKLLDEGFYYIPGTPAAWPLTLTDGQALRFVARAGASFLVTPLPWEMRSRGELAFFPEHVVWLLMVVFTPIGIVAGWRRDPRLTALLIGFVIPMAAALAVTNGNVGTLLRLRGLVTPYVVWLAVLGALTVAEWAARPRPAPAPQQG